MNDDKESYTVAEIADRCGVTPPTVYNWIKSGLKSTVQNDRGRKVYQVIELRDVDEFLHKSIAEASKGFE